MAALPLKKSVVPRTLSGTRPVQHSAPAPARTRIEVELNVFTAQRNPRWLLDPVSADLLLRQLPTDSSLSPVSPGYCGFIVHVDAEGSRREVQVFHNTQLEQWLLNSGRFCLPAELVKLVESQLI